MDSYITEKLKNSSTNIVNKLGKYKYFTTVNIITYSLLLNAFAILAIINGNFYLFILLFLTSFYIQFLGKLNKSIKNDATRMVKLYGRISIWIMFGSVFQVIVTIYDQEITFGIAVLFTIILALCNLNYSFKILNKLETKQFDDNEDINSYLIKKWANLFSKISKNNRDKLSGITRWFDEVMVIIIFVIIVIYINYIKNKNELSKIVTI